MKRFPTLALLPLVIFSFAVVTACSEDDPVTPQKPEPNYFPYVRNAVWTYKTNVFKNDIAEIVTLQVKIDTMLTEYGIYDFLKVGLPEYSTAWAPAIAVKDSAGAVYGLGDSPSDTPYLLFKHKYAESEITRETITVQGKSYQTVKYRFDIPAVGSVYWWFADGVGLVREHSMDGISLFNDNNDDEVLTELVSYVK